MRPRATILAALLLVAILGGWAALNLAPDAPAQSEERSKPTETPTDTTTPTDSSDPPTETESPPPETDTPIPATDTPVPATEPPAPTETAVPTDTLTPVPPTETPTSEPEEVELQASGPEGVLLFDDFETGDLSRWTSQTGMTVQQEEVATGVWAARVTINDASALSRFALPGTYTELYVQIRFKVISQGNNEVSLLHLRNSGSPTVFSAFITPGGRVAIRSESDSFDLGSSTLVTRGTWHELHIGLVITGTTGQTSVRFDGVDIPGLSREIDGITEPITNLVLGERSDHRTYDAAFDDVSIATHPLAILPPPNPGPAPTDTPAPAPTDTAEPEPVSLEFTSIADSMVEENSPNANYGSSTRLRVDGGSGPDVESFLAFDVAGVSGSVTSAILRIYTTTDSNNGPNVALTDSGWSETGITWNNRPARTSGTLDDLGEVGANRWVELDVTGAVTANGVVSFVLFTDNRDGTNMSSREGANDPQLVLTVNGTGEPPPPPPPEPTATGEPSATPQPTATGTSPATATETPRPTATRTTAPTRTPTQVSGETAVVLAAGDISRCSNDNDQQTGDLVRSMEGSVLIPGDLAYEDGSARNFAECYDPAWGSFKDRTFPAPGNHEYHTSGAAGYFDYFGARAGERGKGYYSFDLGEWHIISLNSNCSAIGGCGAGSPQETWLRADLEAHPNHCTLAYWHHPLYSSGMHGNQTQVRALFQALFDYGAEIVLSGHDHTYERFAPQDASARAHADGVREFVVGTGGSSHYGESSRKANSEVRNYNTYGILRLILRPAGYDWEFVPIPGSSFTDSGSGTCHGLPNAAMTSGALAIANPGSDIVVVVDAEQMVVAVLPRQQQLRFRALRPRATRRLRPGAGSRQDRAAAETG